MDHIFYHAIEQSPIIAAVKNPEELENAIKTDLTVIFLLFGDVISIPELVEKVKASGKIAMVHLDLIVGLSPKEVAVDFIHSHTRADGIISTKLNLVNRAHELSMFTVYRLFIIDSMALASLKKQDYLIRADFIEVLPGVMPTVIKKICGMTKKPIIAGGLISNREEAVDALKAGAMSISSTNQAVWLM